MDLFKCIFVTLAKSVDPERGLTVMYSSGFFFFFFFFFFCKLTPLKFKMELSKGILRIFANSVDPVQMPPTLIRINIIFAYLKREYVNVQRRLTPLKFKIDLSKLVNL